MKFIKNLFGIAVMAFALSLAVPVRAQAPVVWSGGIISTGVVAAAFLSTNSYVDVTKPPTPFVNPYVARDSSWFEVPKNQGIAIQVEYGGLATNNLLVFEASLNPASKTNWTNTRFLTVNLPVGGGVLVTNVAASVFANVRGIRLQSSVITNAAGTVNITNVIVGAWK